MSTAEISRLGVLKAPLSCRRNDSIVPMVSVTGVAGLSVLGLIVGADGLAVQAACDRHTTGSGSDMKVALLEEHEHRTVYVDTHSHGRNGCNACNVKGTV